MATKIFKNNEELLALVRESNGMKYIDFEYNDIVCKFDIDLPSVNIVNAFNINAKDIKSMDIYARNINASNIDAFDIDAFDINAKDIKSMDINAFDIKAWNINAKDINVRHINAIEDINVEDIKAGNIYARNINASNIDAWILFSYNNIKCKSYKNTHPKAKEPICLGELEIAEGKEFKIVRKVKAKSKSDIVLKDGESFLD